MVSSFDDANGPLLRNTTDENSDGQNTISPNQNLKAMLNSLAMQSERSLIIDIANVHMKNNKDEEA